jgi:hypothetical protein
VYETGESIFAQRQHVREQMLAMTERLVADYSGVVPAGSVMRCVSRLWLQLRQAGQDGDVVAAVEAAARRRLAEGRPAHVVA